MMIEPIFWPTVAVVLAVIWAFVYTIAENFFYNKAKEAPKKEVIT